MCEETKMFLSFRLLTNAPQDLRSRDPAFFQVWPDDISSRIIFRWIYSLEYVYSNQLFLHSCSSHLPMKFDTRSREDPVSLWRRANAGNVRLYYPYWRYTNFFIFRFHQLYITSVLQLEIVGMILGWYDFSY